VALVRVLPVDVTFEATAGESVMAAAQRQGLWWPTVCGGDAQCGTCWLVVNEGTEHCSAIKKEERARLALGMKANEPRARLACQLRVTGPVTVSRRSVRPAQAQQ
jgi:ferredoxin